MPQQWFIKRDHRESGPFTSEDLRKAKVSGKITRNDLIKNATATSWVEAHEIPWLFPYDVYSPPPSEIVGTPHLFLDGYREMYERAISLIDEDAKRLIEEGFEFRAIQLVDAAKALLVGIWESLSLMYLDIRKNLSLLQMHGSERIKNIQYKLPFICRSFDDFASNSVVREEEVLKQFRGMGAPIKEHWMLNSVCLTEIEFLLEVLRVLIEPDYVPLEDVVDNEERPYRYIPADVRRAVWRRDMGKCCRCGSREKLEFDHIIPIAEGGSNTERNIELLCEFCNRRKGSQIH